MTLVRACVSLPILRCPRGIRVKREERREKREEGRGKREEGRGKREEGRGKREEGRGKDNTFCNVLFDGRRVAVVLGVPPEVPGL